MYIVNSGELAWDMQQFKAAEVMWIQLSQFNCSNLFEDPVASTNNTVIWLAQLNANDPYFKNLFTDEIQQ